MDLYRYSAAFPELVIPILGHLKKFAKLTKVDWGEGRLPLCWLLHSLSCFGELPGYNQMPMLCRSGFCLIFVPQARHRFRICSSFLFCPPFN